MTTITIIILSKNEQANIADCIQSASWADEIIVYDCNSTDDTINIAENLGAKVIIDSEWQGFGNQRIKAQQHASHDWILMLDSDERITDELKNEILKKVSLNDTSSIYAVARLTFCFGRYIRHSGWYPDYVYRLYAREKTQYNNSQVHEKLVIPKDCSIGYLKSHLVHYSYKNLNHYLLKSAYYAEIWASEKNDQGRKTSITTAVLHGIFCFIKMYIFRLGLLDGKQGFILALLSAHSTFIKYLDLWLYKFKKK